MTKTIVTVGGVILAALALATVVKSQSIPAAPDALFEPSVDKLQEAPANIAVVRPTHFPQASAKIKHVHQGDSLARIVGRNVSFRDLLAEAYDCSPGCVVLPSDTPAGGFDFLVTVSPKTRRHLREAIEKQLGYTASSENRSTDVLVLQVQNANLPGLRVSTADDSDIHYQDGKLLFIRQPLSVVVRGLEDGLALPVVDRTGLTNYYDFSVAWSEKTTEAMRTGGFHRDSVDKVLASWGLELKPATEAQDMLIVKKLP